MAISHNKLTYIIILFRNMPSFIRIMVRYINIHTHKQGTEAVQIVNANLFQDLSHIRYASIGIHPWEINKIEIDEAYLWVSNNICNKKVLAIGECGIDRSISVPVETQIEIFEKQIEISEKNNKPVILHCVRAYSDIMHLRKKHNPKQTWIIHGFTGNGKIGEALIKLGCYLSFGRDLLKSDKVQGVFKNIPLEYMFLETDDSEIKIKEVYEKATSLLNIGMDEFKDNIFGNFNKVFNSGKN